MKKQVSVKGSNGVPDKDGWSLYFELDHRARSVHAEVHQMVVEVVGFDVHHLWTWSTTGPTTVQVLVGNSSVTARFPYPFETAAMPITFCGAKALLWSFPSLSLLLIFCQSSLVLLSVRAFYWYRPLPLFLSPRVLSLAQSYLVSFRFEVGCGRPEFCVGGKGTGCAAEKTRWIITSVRWDPELGAVWMTRQQVSWAFGQLSLLQVSVSSQRWAVYTCPIYVKCVNAYCPLHVMMMVAAEQLVCPLECGKRRWMAI